MKQDYDMTVEKLHVVRDRLEATIDLVARQLDSHPEIVAMCLVAIIGDRYGREALESLIISARGMRQTLINGEKADAREARQEHQRQQRSRRAGS
ncbi:hypothetical protein [Sphingomonas montana]|uniref:hypothetical protein n=1 Tax=Sphingomonas montana TaxID=1843236 RepID=UPI00101ADAF5|nr:hypothetical protein [Sphingomonas montana]